MIDALPHHNKLTPQVPSRWESFIERLEGTAKEDCLIFYEAEMQVLHKQYKNGPIGPMRLKVCPIFRFMKFSSSVVEYSL